MATKETNWIDADKSCLRAKVDVQVFGSVATELNLPWSDLDLVVSGIVPWYAKGG